jgi:hypothetical protein
VNRLDIATLPWKRGSAQVLAVADATWCWARLFNDSLRPRQREEVERLISLLRAARRRDRKRLQSETETGLREREIFFRGKPGDAYLKNRFVVPLYAAKIGLGYVVSAKTSTEIMQFQRAIDQTGIINVWDIFYPWRVCDAFQTHDVEGIPEDARHSFEAIWLAGETTAAYAYAESWMRAHVEAAA